MIYSLVSTCNVYTSIHALIYTYINILIYSVRRSKYMVHIAYMDRRGEACRSHVSRLWKEKPFWSQLEEFGNQTGFFVSGSSLRSRRRWILSMWALLAFSKSVTCLQQHKHQSSIIANHSSMITHTQRSASSRDFSISPSFQTYQDKSLLKKKSRNIL